MKRSNLNYTLAGLIILTAASVLLYQNARRIHDTKPQPVVLSEKIVVFAAAGLTQAMQDCTQSFQKQTGCQVELNLASSAVLSRQIAAGARWDVYLSANRQWMEYMLEQTQQEGDGVVELTADRLALVTPAGRTVDFCADEQFARTFAGRLAVGDPQSVPVGIYAKQAFENLGWWDDLADNLVPAVNVSAAQRYVETGECEMGIVYLSGAKMSSKVNVVHIFEELLHEPIRFSAVAERGSESGRQFLEFLTRSPEIFIRNGFVLNVCNERPNQ